MDARPNPFIPIALQKKAGIPQASAESSLALDQRVTDGWTVVRGGGGVLASDEGRGPRRSRPRPLIAGIAEAADRSARLSALPRCRFSLPRKLESFEDWRAPPFMPGKVRGGTRVLADQAACPFRAFAKLAPRRRGDGGAVAGPRCRAIAASSCMR